MSSYAELMEQKTRLEININRLREVFSEALTALGNASPEIRDIARQDIAHAITALVRERDEARAQANARLMNPNTEHRLRDDFAAAALTAMSLGGRAYDDIARTAYGIADAMLAARERKG